MEATSNGEIIDAIEINRRVNFVYRHLLDDFDPAVKKLVETGAALFKALLGVTTSQKAYAEALERVGETAKPCHSETKRIGFAVSDLSQIFKKIQEEQERLFMHPTETNVKEDNTTLNELWKSYHKGQKSIAKEMQKGKKNGMVTDELQKQIHLLRNEGLRQALNEEKKRYIFVLERHCAWMEEYTNLQKQSIELLNPHIAGWKDMCHTMVVHDEEPDAALALLDSAIRGEAAMTPPGPTPHGTYSELMEKTTTGSPTRPAIQTVESRSSSISLSETGDHQTQNEQTTQPPESAVPAPLTVFTKNAVSVEEVGVVSTETVGQEDFTVTAVETSVKVHDTPVPVDQQNGDVERRGSSVSQSSNSTISSNSPNQIVDRSDSGFTHLPLSSEITVQTYQSAPIPPPPPPPELRRPPSPAPVILHAPAPPPPPELRRPASPAPVILHGPPPPRLSPPVRKKEGYSSPVLSRRQTPLQNSSPTRDFVAVRETTAVYKSPQPLDATPRSSAMKSSGSNSRVSSSVQFSESVIVRSPASSVGEADSVEGPVLEAVFNYSATTESQMTIKTGDAIKILQEGKQGWVYGQNMRSNMRGWFPGSYCRHQELVSPTSPPISNAINGYKAKTVTHVDSGRVTERDRVIQVSPPQDEEVIIVKDKSNLHRTNYDTVPKNNPFAHVKLRHVVLEDGKPKKYT